MLSATLVRVTRTKGSRSRDYDARREELLRAFQRRLIEPDSAPPSLRELAAAANVSIATVRHYFGGREGAVLALIEHLGREGEPHIAHSATRALPLAASVEELVRYLWAGFRFGLTEIHALGFREGLGNSTAGPAYLKCLLEPSLNAVEARLAAHAEAGELRTIDLRYSAIMLVAPLLVAALHQKHLGGEAIRHLDEELFLKSHIDAVLLVLKK